MNSYIYQLAIYTLHSKLYKPV